jgi:hypothetical protein
MCRQEKPSMSEKLTTNEPQKLKAQLRIAWGAAHRADEERYEMEARVHDLRAEVARANARAARAHAEAHEDSGTSDAAWHSVWLHGNWRYLTSQMTTPERERAADAVHRHDRKENPDEPELSDLRWWMD